MSQGRNPSGEEGFVLRRVHKNQCSAKDPFKILPVGFRPTRDDVDGISVNLANEISPEELAAAARKPEECYVVRIPIQLLKKLGLTLDHGSSDPHDQKGHMVIPQLSLSEYEKNKDKLKEIQIELARVATQNIVYRPP